MTLLRVQHLQRPFDRYSTFAFAQTSLFLTKYYTSNAFLESQLKIKVPHWLFSNYSQILFSTYIICTSNLLVWNCRTDLRLWFSACRSEICPSYLLMHQLANPQALRAISSMRAVQFSTNLAIRSSMSSQMSNLRHSWSSPSKVELAQYTCPSRSFPSPIGFTVRMLTILAILALWPRVFIQLGLYTTLSRSMLRSFSNFACDFFQVDLCSPFFPSDFLCSRVLGYLPRMEGALCRKRRGLLSFICVFFRQVLARVQVVLWIQAQLLREGVTLNSRLFCLEWCGFIAFNYQTIQSHYHFQPLPTLPSPSRPPLPAPTSPRVIEWISSVK